MPPILSKSQNASNKFIAARESDREKDRIQNLLNLIPEKGIRALDIGARDGFISIALTDHFDSVFALDLEKVNITHKKVITIQGDVTNMDFPDNYFDLVLCAEVLEHIPSPILEKACEEIIRVSNKYVIIGVPYKQDIRIGATVCSTCGNVNPPWGHVNRFDEEMLRLLFSKLNEQKISYVGKNRNRKSNALSYYLLTIAGHPYGTYNQEECCIYCGKRLTPPTAINIIDKLLSLASIAILKIQSIYSKWQPIWIHILLKKP